MSAKKRPDSPSRIPANEPLPNRIEDWPLAAIELYQERFAISQFDGGLPEAEARAAAEEEVRAKWCAGFATRSPDTRAAGAILNAIAPLLPSHHLRVLLSARSFDVGVEAGSLRIRVTCRIEPDTIRLADVEERGTPKTIIKSFRTRTGMTVKQIAEKAGVHPGTVQKIQSESKGVGDRARAAVAAVVGCAPEDLVPKRKKPQPLQRVRRARKS